MDRAYLQIKDKGADESHLHIALFCGFFLKLVFLDESTVMRMKVKLNMIV